MLRTKVKPDSAVEAEAGVKALFAALEEEKPQGIRYSSYRMSDGVTYVVLLEVQDGVDNPLPGIAAFRDFQSSLGGWLAEPPAPEQLTAIGDYQS